MAETPTMNPDLKSYTELFVLCLIKMYLFIGHIVKDETMSTI